MGKRVRSAKGEMIDFDFLKIKEQLAAAPAPMEVRARENFIERKMKRKIKKIIPESEPVKVEAEPIIPEVGEVKPAAEPKSVTKQPARKKKIIKDTE